ncbi:TPA: TIGR00725 family protein [Burkholderia vietnamiensis]|nr:TIGR00725 family protein [Burkholderia vietnamiensis]
MFGNGGIEWSEAARDQLARLAQRQNGVRRHRMPVGVIGPRDATDEQMRVAEWLAHALATAGVALVGGGKQGVMEAAARGAHAAGGCAIGLLPEDDASLANPYLSVALPTGLGITRNALVARASLCLIAVGGGLGTLSEIALGLQWGKPVFTICDAPQVAGVECFDDADRLVARVAQWLADSA